VATELRVPRALGHRRAAWLRVRVRNVGALPVRVAGVEMLARFSDGTPAGEVEPLFPVRPRLRPGRSANAYFRWRAPGGDALDTEPVLFSACASIAGADANPENDCDLVLRGRGPQVELPMVDDGFEEPSPSSYWEWFQTGTGSHAVSDGIASFTVSDESHADAYSDAEINDYRRGYERGFPWGPGVRLAIRARASDDNGVRSDQGRGTRGFGFWNLGTGGPGASDGMTSAWFISVSPESFGFGVFMATVFDRGRPVMLHPLSVDLRRWHEYGIVWTRRGVTFAVDDRLVAASPVAPDEKLGFVAWIDNFVLSLTGDGIGTEFLDLDRDQTLFVDSVRLLALDPSAAR
jgi:hypothetical protein